MVFNREVVTQYVYHSYIERHVENETKTP